ncbi:MAG: HAD family hydrolase [Candidatus Liptonbacteria bacterium]|nr:HAD family hydrolase [Candidatus Liptonbacteria bacterium]
MGVPGRHERKLRKLRAIFLDRDGTIIRHVELMRRIADLKFLPYVARAIRAFNKLGFLVVVITNQPVIARGLATPKEIDRIHAVLVRRLKTKGASVDAVYFCPHHPNADMRRYRLACSCRKPEPGMILKALKKYRINPKQSYIIGDGLIDVVAGKRASLKTILVKTGPGSREDLKYKHIRPDFLVKNLSQAIKIISNAK